MPIAASPIAASPCIVIAAPRSLCARLLDLHILSLRFGHRCCCVVASCASAAAEHGEVRGPHVAIDAGEGLLVRLLDCLIRLLLLLIPGDLFLHRLGGREVNIHRTASDLDSLRPEVPHRRSRLMRLMKMHKRDAFGLPGKVLGALDAFYSWSNLGKGGEDLALCDICHIPHKQGLRRIQLLGGVRVGRGNLLLLHALRVPNAESLSTDPQGTIGHFDELRRRLSVWKVNVRQVRANNLHNLVHAETVLDGDLPGGLFDLCFAFAGKTVALDAHGRGRGNRRRKRCRGGR
mmetsp:Transcript_63977/g.183897  ORF Transcript_63977/g.183897 Transcript_63977/m.183897 type:complete len:290 (+) Transcript_63977:96-965(+)